VPRTIFPKLVFLHNEQHLFQITKILAGTGRGTLQFVYV
jgi:hypothetical protein